MSNYSTHLHVIIELIRDNNQSSRTQRLGEGLERTLNSAVVKLRLCKRFINVGDSRLKVLSVNSVTGLYEVVMFSRLYNRLDNVEKNRKLVMSQSRISNLF